MKDNTIADLLRHYRRQISSASSEMSRGRKLDTDREAIEFLRELDIELNGVYMTLYALGYYEASSDVAYLRTMISTSLEEIEEDA